MPKLVIRNQVLYLLVFIMWAVTCLLLTRQHHIFYRDQHILFLKSCEQAIVNVFLKDLDLIINEISTQELVHSPVLTKVSEKSPNLNLVESPFFEITENRTSIVTSTGEWNLDIQVLREMFDGTLPKSLDYQVSIDDKLLLSRNSLNIESEEFKIDEVRIGRITFNIGINESSKYYLRHKKQLLKNIAINWAVVSSLSLLFTYIIWRTIGQKNLIVQELNRQKNSVIQELSADLIKEQKKTQALLLDKKGKQKIKELFIKKATQILIKNQGNSDDESTINLEPTEYLFPLALEETSRAKINIKDLVDCIRDYFAYDILLNNFEINAEVEFVELECSKESFYQIILSLIQNVVNITNDQFKDNKYISIKILADEIIIDYRSYPMSREQTIKIFSEFSSLMNVFVLGFEKLIELLEACRFQFMTSYDSGINTMNIKYPIIELSESSANKDNKIINILKYQRTNK